LNHASTSAPAPSGPPVTYKFLSPDFIHRGRAERKKTPGDGELLIDGDSPLTTDISHKPVLGNPVLFAILQGSKQDKI